MKKFSLALLALAMALAITPAASADSINGSIAVIGLFDTWNSSGITFNDKLAIASGTGTLAKIPLFGTGFATVKSFDFASPDVQLFSVDFGYATFTIFGAVDVLTNNSTFLNIVGQGWLNEKGYDPTRANFSLTSTANGISAFSIAATTTPEPGSLLLLGTGLLGLAVILFRKAKPSRLVLNM